MSNCIRGSCGHPQSHHYENNEGDVLCVNLGVVLGLDAYECDCDGFQDEPTEAQLQSLNDTSRVSQRELQEAGDEGVML